MCVIHQFGLVLVSLLVFGAIHTGTGVKIKKLQVPKVIQHGAPVVLDCDFILEDFDDTVGLVVKWYFNENDNKPVYQWIPGSRKKPQELGLLKGRLNLEYAASVDANSVHRALHILKPSPDLSGDYTCHVATFQSEDRKTKSMLVFVPEKNLMLKKFSGRDDGFIRVLCTADGVFPKPTMTLRSQERDIAQAEVVVRERGQLFDISASTSLPALKDPEEFSCELRIPQANYTVRRETVFYPGDSAKAITMCRWLSLAPWIILMWTNLVLHLDKTLDDFVSKKSKQFISRLQIDDSFLPEDVSSWDNNAAFLEAKRGISRLKVVNDTAERAVKLMQDFQGLMTAEEEQKQFLLCCVQEHRNLYPDCKKHTLKRSYPV